MAMAAGRNIGLLQAGAMAMAVAAAAVWTAAGGSHGSAPQTGPAAMATQVPQPASPWAAWKNGPPKDPGFFPVAVWLQAPANAPRYKAAGINLYIGLWKGPTDEQLAALKAANMPVICEQNQVGLNRKDDPIIVGWMHGDEPDNAQPLPGGGYGPPIPPADVVASYQKLRSADPTRPVVLNLGQGVAWDGWHGRGVRTNHPEDYPEYVKGCDVVSFDIYPAVSDRKEVAGKLWLVAHGVDRLVQWTGGRKIVWNCIECTRIGNPDAKPTPHQVRAEVWMSIVHGSTGLIYFVHQFKPTFIEAGLLADAEMLAAVTNINRQIHALAAVLNSPAAPDGATVKSSSPDVPVDVLVKRHGGSTYLFAVCMRPAEVSATFRLPAGPRQAAAEVIDEGRSIPIVDGTFQDAFKPFDVHLYRIRGDRR